LTQGTDNKEWLVLVNAHRQHIYRELMVSITECTETANL